MEAVIQKIYATSEKAMGELSKKELKQWGPQSENVLKFILDRLTLCFDEVTYHMQTINLTEEANLISKLAGNYNAVFNKIVELQHRKPSNPPEMPMEYCHKPYLIQQKSIFGGTEIIPYETHISMQSKFLQAEQQYRPTKVQKIRNVQSKGTDTNEDALSLLAGNYMGDKEKELLSLQHQSEEFLQELNKQLKLRGLWQEAHASNAVNKLGDLSKFLEKEGYRNELFLNDQLRIQNDQEDEQYKDVKKEIKDNIVVIQRRTADKIMSAAQLNMKSAYERFLLKKTAGMLLRKSKADNFQRLDELEKLMVIKNEEIIQKEAKITQLLTNFKAQEKRLSELMGEIDNYKQVNERLDTFSSNRNLNGHFDIELQVSFPDPQVTAMAAQLSEIIAENERMKLQVNELHEMAQKEKQKSLSQPTQIEEVLMMVLQAELTPENKIETLEELLIYIKENSEQDTRHMAANDLFKVVRQKAFQKRNNRHVQDDSDKQPESSDESPLIKKGRKSKVKKPKEVASLPVSNQFLDSSNERQRKTQKKQAMPKEPSEESLPDASQTLNIEDFMKKKQPPKLNKITEESGLLTKKSQRIQDQLITPKSSKRIQQQVQPPQPQKDIKVEIPKEQPSHFKTETQRQQLTSQSRLNPVGTYSRQSVQQPSSSGRLKTNNQQQATNEISATRQTTNQPQRKILSLYYQSDLDEGVDEEYVSENQTNKGVQVQPPPQMNQFNHKVISQQQSLMLGSQEQTVTQTPPPRYSMVPEKVTSKVTQTDDFFLWKLFQDMSKDLGLSVEQSKRLESIFLNEQQIVHFYERDENQKLSSRIGSAKARHSSLDARNISIEPRYSSLDNTKPIQESMKQSQHSRDISDIEPIKRGSVVRLSRQLQGSPLTQKTAINLQHNDNSLQINQYRSLSQTQEGIIVPGMTTSQDLKKRQSLTYSQKVLEDMLKQKQSIQPSESEQREIKLYFNVFGEEFQDEQEFEMEAIRHNLGKPLDLIIDHLKDDVIKRVFANFIGRTKNPWGDQLYMIISQFANKPAHQITYVDFKKYYENYMRAHKKCGEQCIHMQRFLARIGFGVQLKRKLLNTSKQSMQPFGGLPKLK